MTNNAIEIDRLRCSYPAQNGEPIPVFDGLSLNIREGSFVAAPIFKELAAGLMALQ